MRSSSTSFRRKTLIQLIETCVHVPPNAALKWAWSMRFVCSIAALWFFSVSYSFSSVLGVIIVLQPRCSCQTDGLRSDSRIPEHAEKSMVWFMRCNSRTTVLQFLWANKIVWVKFSFCLESFQFVDDRSQPCLFTLIPKVNLASPISVTYKFWDCGRTGEFSVTAQASRGVM